MTEATYARAFVDKAEEKFKSPFARLFMYALTAPIALAEDLHKKDPSKNKLL